MCYHTTCLYSLCGHTSISQRPIRNVPSCQQKGAAIFLSSKTSATTHQPPATFQSFISPFPSPQEFEFARDLHHSVPSSPTSPITTKRSSAKHSQGATRQTIDIIDTYTLAEIDNSSSPSDILNIYTLPSPSPISRPMLCPQSQSHPLHTFTVPTLCPPCRYQREANLARFEARAIRDSVSREGGTTGTGGGQRGQIGHGRRKIPRPGNGTLIPLICVEEGRLREEEMAVKKNDGSSVGNDSKDGAVVVDDGGDESDESTVSAEKVSSENFDISSKNSDGKLSNALKKSPTPFSGWSWWNKKASTATLTQKSIAPESETKLTVEVPQPVQHAVSQIVVEEGDILTGSKVWSRESSEMLGQRSGQRPRTNLDDDVPRDAAGRNAKGMERILAWGGAGSDLA